MDDKIYFTLADFPIGTSIEAAQRIVSTLNEEFGKCAFTHHFSSVREHPFSQRFPFQKRIRDRLEELLTKNGDVGKTEIVFRSSNGFHVEYDRRRWSELNEVQRADEILRLNAIWQRKRQMERIRHEYVNLDYLPDRHRLIVETAVSLLPERLQLLFVNMNIRFNLQEGTPFAFANAFDKNEPITNREIYLPPDLPEKPTAVQLVVHELIHHLHHHFEIVQEVETDEERELLRVLQERSAERFSERYTPALVPSVVK